jgi:hypothetical protein
VPYHIPAGTLAVLIESVLATLVIELTHVAATLAAFSPIAATPATDSLTLLR